MLAAADVAAAGAAGAADAAGAAGADVAAAGADAAAAGATGAAAAYAFCYPVGADTFPKSLWASSASCPSPAALTPSGGFDRTRPPSASGDARQLLFQALSNLAYAGPE